MEELIRSYRLPFYVKINVESHEVSVLTGMQSVVPAVSFEVNLPRFKPEALHCIELLEWAAAEETSTMTLTVCVAWPSRAALTENIRGRSELM